jgi:hypothetical protein
LFKPATPEQLTAREDEQSAEIRAKVAAYTQGREGPPWVGHEPGICPVCGSDNLEWGDDEKEGEHLFYEFTCGDCNSSGSELYRMEYIDTEVKAEGINP